MRFSVPQFIEVEDKVFGQLTFKQGVYIIGSVGITVAIFIKAGFLFALIFGGPLVLLAFLLSFIKVHGQPFINILYSFTYYLIKDKLYLWKKTEKKTVENDALQGQEKTPLTRPTSPHLSQSKLRELAWTLDTKDTFDRKK